MPRSSPTSAPADDAAGRPLSADATRPPRAAAGRPLRADAQRNRERILAAATEAFAAEGLGVSLDELARRAGVGPGTLYRHFPTKESLFEAVVDDRLRRLCHEAEALGTSTDPGVALRSFLDRLVVEASPKQDLVDALVRADIDVGVALAETGADLRRAVGELLRRAQDTGAVRSDATLADLMVLVSGLLVALRQRARAGADPDRALAILWDGLATRSHVPALPDVYPM